MGERGKIMAGIETVGQAAAFARAQGFTQVARQFVHELEPLVAAASAGVRRTSYYHLAIDARPFTEVAIHGPAKVGAAREAAGLLTQEVGAMGLDEYAGGAVAQAHAAVERSAVTLEKKISDLAHVDEQLRALLPPGSVTYDLMSSTKPAYLDVVGTALRDTGMIIDKGGNISYRWRPSTGGHAGVAAAELLANLDRFDDAITKGVGSSGLQEGAIQRTSELLEARLEAVRQLANSDTVTGLLDAGTRARMEIDRVSAEVAHAMRQGTVDETVRIASAATARATAQLEVGMLTH